MSIIKKAQSTTQYEYTPQVSETRRSLFPPDIVDSEEDSDLGHISPLRFDSDHDDLNCLPPVQEFDKESLLSKSDSIGDYDILGVVDNVQHPICTLITDKRYSCSDTVSPLYLSPHCNKFMPTCETDIINETPCKTSPSYNLKTPHDTSNTASKVPKLARKSLLDILDFTSTKRKLSPSSNSPEQNKSKHLKLDPKSSKVRTTLFPEIDIALPTKNFYPKTENIMGKVRNNRETGLKSLGAHNVSRKGKSKTKIGQINAGVGHKIRKPKQKKISKAALIKAATTALNSGAINDYIKDPKDLKATKNEVPSLIENKENADPKPTEGRHAFAPKLMENGIQNDATNVVEMDTGNKCPLSPVAEPDPTKKFFKYSRAKGVVTVNENIKLKVDHGKVTLLQNQKKRRMTPKIELDSSDLTVDEPLLPKSNIDSILSSLDNVNGEINMPENSTKIVLQAHSSITASENSILLHAPPAKCVANVILSPISQMCDVTSGLALNSPKKAKNLTSILNGMPSATPSDTKASHDCSTDEGKQKLFPIFYAKNTSVLEKKENKAVPRTAKKFKKLDESQMLLNAGQKRFGWTQCTECSFVYHIGEPSDESMHLNYHKAGHVLRFTGWKNERVIADFNESGRIIQILPEDSKIWWKKAKELMDLVNREIGCYEMEFSLDHCQVYLYIRSRTIAGCVVAVPESQGHRILTSKPGEPDLCSQHTYPIKCGIPRIWVSRNYHRQGVATALMNAVKKNFILGNVLEDSDIALSSPTDLGKYFAEGYFKTSNFLIYF